MATALLVIDVQQGMFSFPTPLFDGEAVVARIAGLIAGARAAGVPVFHVRHDGGPGHALAKGAPGWPHHPAVAPAAGETVIDKRHSSAFHDTDLDPRLRAAGVEHLVLAGVQTEMCVESACRHAVALGYRVTIAADGHSTYDTPQLSAAQIIAHHNRVWGRGFAALAPITAIRFT